MFQFKNRAVISITGKDAANYLQGIISNDIRKCTPENILYALMLTPQGKLLYDFFIYFKEDGYYLDIPKAYLEEIMKKFQMYKLRASITIATHFDEYKVYGSLEKKSAHSFVDPRSNNLGFRWISKDTSIIDDYSYNKYEVVRINNKIPEMTFDLTPGVFFPLELGMSDFAIDYSKGCYIGQEVTARTHHRGVIRKKIFTLEVINNPPPKLGDELFQGNNKVGIALGFEGNLGLSLLRFEDLKEKTHITLKEGGELKLVN